MATTEKADFDSLAATDPEKAEAIYKAILQGLQQKGTVFVYLTAGHQQNQNPRTNMTKRPN